MTLFSYKVILASTVNNKGIYGLHNITAIHMVTGVELDIRAILVWHYGRESFRKPVGDKILWSDGNGG